MKDEYISVSEFARRAGVTKQSVYQRIQGRLKKYVKDLNGQKVIHIKALNEVYTQSKSKRSWTDAMHIGSI